MPPTPRTALVYDAHDYDPVSKADNPHDADDPAPAPCKCGSGKDAFIHHKDAAANGATVVQQVEAVDTATGAEKASGRNG